jgi:hypothetical protein
MSEKDVREFTNWLEEMPDGTEPGADHPQEEVPDWLQGAEEAEPQAEPKKVPAPALPEVQISNLEVAAKNLMALKAHIDELCAKALKITIIRDKETAEAATILAKQLKTECADLEKMRKHFADPLLRAKRSVDGWFAGYTEPLASGENYLRKLLSNFRQYQETERRRLQAEQEAASKRLQEEQEAKAEEARKQGILYEPAPPPPIVTPPVTKVIHAGGATASQRRVPKVVVDDEKLLPDEYWTRTVNMEKLEMDLKAGIVVPGARLEEEFITQIR